MRKIFLFILTTCIGSFCFAQADSTIIYKDRDGKKTNADNASTYTVITRADSIWYGKTYDSKTNALITEGSYQAADGTRRSGVFKSYAPEGFVEKATLYNRGLEEEVTWYYKNGNKRSYVSFDEKHSIKKQVGWDESGNEIKNFIVMHLPVFKGGEEGYRKYLEKNIDNNVAAKSGVKAGKYTIIIVYTVMEDGSVGDVTISGAVKECNACEEEGKRLLRNMPKWKPAIENNTPVKFKMRQAITFVVEL